MRAGGAVWPQQRGQARHHAARAGGIAGQHGDHLRHIHRPMARVPAIKVGDHRHGRIAKLCLAGEFGFGHVGHPDHVAAPAAIDLRFGQRGKLGAFHAKIGAALMHGDALCPRGHGTGRAKAGAGGMGQADMRDTTRAEEGFLAGKGAVDELVDNHEVARGIGLAEGSAGRDRDHVGHAKALHRINIGAVGHVGGGMDMAAPVAGKEGHRDAVKAPDQHLVRGRAPGGCHLDPACAFQPVDLVQA